MSQHTLGVLDHVAIGEKSVDEAYNTLKGQGRLQGVQCDKGTKIGKDGKDEDEEGNRLACEDNGGSTLELKVGTKDNQHIVSISPQDKGKGTDFALVYVQTRGESKDTI